MQLAVGKKKLSARRLKRWAQLPSSVSYNIQPELDACVRTHCLFLRFLSRCFYLFIYLYIVQTLFFFPFVLLSSHRIQISIKKLFLIHFATLYALLDAGSLARVRLCVLVCECVFAHLSIPFGFILLRNVVVLVIIRIILCAKRFVFDDFV